MSDGGKNHDEICGDEGAEVFALDLESVPEALVEIPSKINEVDIEFASSVNRMVTKNLVDGMKHCIRQDIAPGHVLSTVYVSSANDSHSPPSRHVGGRAVDMSRINGKKMSVHYPSDATVAAVTNALQVEFETFAFRRENFGPHFKKKNGQPYQVGGHTDHIHHSVNDTVLERVPRSITVEDVTTVSLAVAAGSGLGAAKATRKVMARAATYAVRAVPTPTRSGPEGASAFRLTEALERAVLRQAGASEVTVLEGVVPAGGGAARPDRFWSLVLADGHAGVRAFCFLLEPDETDEHAPLSASMIPIVDLEQMVDGLALDESIRDADQVREAVGEAVRRDAGLARTVASTPRDESSRLIWDDATSVSALEKMLLDGDRASAEALLDALIAKLEKTPDRLEAKIAKRVLAAVRRDAWFDRLHALAEAFDRVAQNDPAVLLQLNQARIELGQLTHAAEALMSIQRDAEDELGEKGVSPPEKRRAERILSEAVGLRGRAYKQLYINARPTKHEPRAYDLKMAQDLYWMGYELGGADYLWHGINYVAMLTHEERIRKGRADVLSRKAEPIAKAILEATDDKSLNGTLDPWDIANRLEAKLAIGQRSGALEEARNYLDRTDAFGAQSTHRQLVEIWGLTEDEAPGDEILPMFRSFIAKSGGTGTVVSLEPAAHALYEKVWSETGYQPLEWLRTAFERAASVARLGRSVFSGQGTGFLFPGDVIGPEFADLPLILTNAHVCSNDPKVQAQHPYPMPPKDVVVAFLDDEKEAKPIRIETLLWTSPPWKLDATLLQLKAWPEGRKPVPVSKADPLITTKRDARLNVIGHPHGLQMSVSLQDNRIVEVGTKYVHYRTPTDPGSSGSPVFNQQWELVALHHASSGAREANEGVRIDVIIEALKKALVV